MLLPLAVVGPIEDMKQRFWELCTNVLVIPTRPPDTKFCFLDHTIQRFTDVHDVDHIGYGEQNVYLQPLFEDYGFECVMVNVMYVFVPFLDVSNEQAVGHHLLIGTN